MKEDKKEMAVIINSTIRGIVKSVNIEGIQKEDIVTLIKDNGQFLLVYFK